ncbi:SDR family NAD(P)-dependent oxidoreductase [Streptomyces sp. NBC_00878]|uniref:SDR family NAD(P)-dependent oxidoreductase n=1 Tax=Streptomyces sp. NBC_00878 TaxID=2975854 RepID=UPI00224D624B|nr:SDR family NAD(P)-dependent oxidoreductase [Streptomyces sp. NBC_00878]MCX4906305.1 SDR family NAD(P)-dependent oxidoreductase [Streptomyces sp. NBC_00878]
MSNNLRDKVAIVTGSGSGSGIGRVTARILAECGASVVVAGLISQAGEDVAKEIRSAGGSEVAVATDVTHEEQIRAMADTAVYESGRRRHSPQQRRLGRPDVIRRDIKVTGLEPASLPGCSGSTPSAAP